METIKIFLWALWMTMAVAGLGSLIDIVLIKKGHSDKLKPKWLWNLVEGVIIASLIWLKFPGAIPWWYFAWLLFTVVPIWSALHDCWIGLGLAGDPWYLGLSKWDRKMAAIFNQFGVRPGKLFLLFKLFWFGILSAGFFSL